MPFETRNNQQQAGEVRLPELHVVPPRPLGYLTARQDPALMNTDKSWLMAPNNPEHPRLTFLIFFHVVLCCVSLVYVSQYHDAFHIFYDPARLYVAVALVAAFAVVSYLFVLADFSFGYFIGFYFYTMVLGYLWLNCFSDLDYNHRLGGLSAAASAITFLLPALFISSPIRQRYALSVKALDRLLTFSLVAAAATIAIGAIYNFKLVSLDNMYAFRADLVFPFPLGYWIGITSNALLPFAFGCFALRRNYWRAGITLLLLLIFYPITLTKLALFTPAWLVLIAVLSRMFEARIIVVISLILPMLLGVILIALLKEDAIPYFDVVNFRMVAVPSNAMDVYNDFFSGHDLTYFCQITLLKPLMDCPYQDQLSIVMANAYALGNFNASLFSTEGIASVGPLFAPLSVFMCGLVIAVANRASAGLPHRFILISGAIFPQILLNVPLTTTLLTHGAAVLFLLWYITPRSMFEQEASRQTAIADGSIAAREACSEFAK
jgi:hypothetical protein